MKALYLSGLLLWSISTFAQENSYADPANPSWTKLLYSEELSEKSLWKLANERSHFLKSNPFEKNNHTQYYKRLLREQGRSIDGVSTGSTPLYTTTKNRNKYLQKTTSTNKSSLPEWKGLGPFDYDDGAAIRSYAPGAAHIYTVEKSQSNPNILYAGTATAGAWKTQDNGANWELITADLLINKVLAIEIDKQNADNVWIAGDYLFFNSKDGGKNWQEINLHEDGLEIYDIVQHTHDSKILFVASNKGLYRSDNYGQKWIRIIDTEHRSLAIQEIECHPTNPDIIYCVYLNDDQTQFYKSVDKGLSFESKTDGWPDISQENNAHQRRTEIAVSQAKPNNIYALAAGQANGGSGLYGFYISEDAGESWQFKCCGNNPGEPASHSNKNILGWAVAGNISGGQYYYDLSLDVSDTQPIEILAGGINLWRSTDDGKSWTINGPWTYSKASKYVHADIHDIRFFGNEVWVASDGGVYRSEDRGNHFEKRMYGIQGTDFKGFGVGQRNGDLMIGGTYHNSTLVKNGDTYINGWTSTAIGTKGGDNYRGHVNPGQDNVAYIDKNGSVGRIELSDQRNQNFSTHDFEMQPNASYTLGLSCNLAFDPWFHEHIYSGVKDKIWKSTNNGQEWNLLYDFAEGYIISIEVAPSNPNIIYAVQNQNHPSKPCLIWKSVNKGISWSDITPTFDSNSSYPIDLQVSGTDPDRIWITRIPQYANSSNLDGEKVFTSLDGGLKWYNITSPILNGEKPTNIVHQIGSDNVYLGTRRAVYHYDSKFDIWYLYNNKLPASTFSTQLVPYYKNQKLRNGTNRGVFEVDFASPSDIIPIASVDHTTNICEDRPFKFSNLSTQAGDEISYKWYFPGGMPASSTEENPEVVYTDEGQYTVILEAHNGNKKTSTTMPSMITIINDCNSFDTKSAQSLLLDGGPSRIISDEITIDKNAVTTLLWIHSYGIQNGYKALIEWDDQDGKSGLYIDNENQLRYQWNGDYIYQKTGLFVPKDTWAHVGMCIESDRAKVFFNGNEVVFHNTHILSDLHTNLSIGKDDTYDDRSFYGELDEISLWNKAMTLDEVRAKRHLCLTKDDTGGLKIYYQFNEDGTAVVDKKSAKHLHLEGTWSRETSTAPVGSGICQKIDLDSTGEAYFDKAKLKINFDNTSFPTGSIYVTKMNGVPDHIPDAKSNFDTYWIVNNYGSTNQFSELEGLSFYDLEALQTMDISDPSLLILYKRESNDWGNSWGAPIDYADEIELSTEKRLSFTHHNGITNFSQFYLSQSSVLPVDWLGIKGEIVGEMAKIKWDVAQEINVSHYEIEISLDGNDFEEIGQVIARNLLEKSRYIFDHYDIVEGLSYYRVKSVDYDGYEEYSDVVSVRYEPKDKFPFDVHIAPNPIQNGLDLRLLSVNSDEVHVQVFNSIGQQMDEFTFYETYLYNTENLNPGAYHFVLTHRGSRQNKTVIVQ